MYHLVNFCKFESSIFFGKLDSFIFNYFFHSTRCEVIENLLVSLGLIKKKSSRVSYDHFWIFWLLVPKSLELTPGVDISNIIGNCRTAHRFGKFQFMNFANRIPLSCQRNLISSSTDRIYPSKKKICE